MRSSVLFLCLVAIRCTKYFVDHETKSLIPRGGKQDPFRTLDQAVLALSKNPPSEIENYILIKKGQSHKLSANLTLHGSNGPQLLISEYVDSEASSTNYNITTLIFENAGIFLTNFSLKLSNLRLSWPKTPIIPIVAIKEGNFSMKQVIIENVKRKNNDPVEPSKVNLTIISVSNSRSIFIKALSIRGISLKYRRLFTFEGETENRTTKVEIEQLRVEGLDLSFSSVFFLRNIVEASLKDIQMVGSKQTNSSLFLKAEGTSNSQMSFQDAKVSNNQFFAAARFLQVATYSVITLRDSVFSYNSYEDFEGTEKQINLIRGITIDKVYLDNLTFLDNPGFQQFLLDHSRKLRKPSHCYLKAITIEQKQRTNEIVKKNAMQGFAIEEIDKIDWEHINIKGLMCWNVECVRVSNIQNGSLIHIGFERIVVVGESLDVSDLSAFLLTTRGAGVLDLSFLKMDQMVTIINPNIKSDTQKFLRRPSVVTGGMIISMRLFRVSLRSVEISKSEVRLPNGFAITAADGISIRCSELKINNMNFDKIGEQTNDPRYLSLKYGALLIFSSLSAELSYITCEGSVSYKGGCLTILAQGWSTTTLSNSTFINNIAVQGAAVFISSEDNIPLKFKVTNTRFSENDAVEGSTLYFVVPSLLSPEKDYNKEITLENVTIKEKQQVSLGLFSPHILLRLDRAHVRMNLVEFATTRSDSVISSPGLKLSSDQQNSKLSIIDLRVDWSEAKPTMDLNQISLIELKSIAELSVFNATFLGTHSSSFGQIFEMEDVTSAIFDHIQMTNSGAAFGRFKSVQKFTLQNSTFKRTRTQELIYRKSVNADTETQIINSTFEDNTCLAVALVHLTFAPLIQPSDIPFNTRTVIRNCTFKRNQGMRYGAVYIHHDNLIVENSTFEGNEGMFQGAIAFIDNVRRTQDINPVYLSMYSLNVLNSNFTNNIGIKGTGGIFCGGALCQYSGLNHSGNRGRIQPDVAGIPKAISALVNTTGAALHCSLFQPEALNYSMQDIDESDIGIKRVSNRYVPLTKDNFLDCTLEISHTEPLGQQILFTLLDFDDNPVYRFPATIIAGVSVDSASKQKVKLEGNKEDQTNHSGIFQHSSLIITAPRLTKFTLEVRVSNSALKDNKAPSVSADEYIDLKLLMQIKMRDCIGGEYFDNEGFCRSCPRGTFSIVPRAHSCYKCPTTGEAYCTSKNELIVPASSWRLNATSHYGFSCKNPKGCLGDNQCSKGFTGPLCAACSQVEGEKSIPMEPYKCSLCQTSFSTLWDWVILLGRGVSFVVGIVLLVLQIKSAIEVSKKLTDDPLLLVDDGDFKTNRQAGVLWKHVLSYYQLISIFSSFGEFFKEYSMIFKPPFTQVMYFLECYTSIATADPLQLYLRFMAYKCLVYCLITFPIMLIFLRNSPWSSFWPSYHTACIVILQNLFPSVITAMMFAQQCNKTLENAYSISFMTIDARYMCGTSKHEELTTFALITLIAYCFTMVLFPVILFVKNDELEDLRMSLGYFYNDYNKVSYNWEFLKIFQKVFLIFLVVQFENDYQNKTLTMIIFLCIYYALLHRFRPFVNELLNNIDSRVTLIYISTLFLSFYVRGNQVSWLRIPALALMWGMNSCFVVYMAYQLYITYKDLFGEKVYSCLTWIGDRISSLFKDKE